MKQLTDIYTDLDLDVDASNLDKPNLETTKPIGETTNDISWNKKDINLMWLKTIKVIKNKTKIFDSLCKYKKLKDIDLIKTHKFNFYLNNKLLFNSKIFKRITLWIIIIFLFFITDWLLIRSYIKHWYNNIIAISNSKLDINDTKEKINDSKFDFIISDYLFKPFLLIPYNNSIWDIKNIIKWWRSLSILLDDIFNYYWKILEFTKEKQINEIYFTNIIKNSKQDFLRFENLLNNTLSYYEKIWNIFSWDLKEKFEKSRNDLKYFYTFLTILNRNFDIFLDIFWHKEEKKYLVLFQNNDEIRPTWWFIWSLWIVSIYKWKIKSFEKEDIYALEWEINKVYKDKIASPEWINKVSKELWLRDSNYEIDFNDSSKNIKFFTDKINKKIDWVIYLNQNVVLELLKELWPIEFEKMWETITNENFSQLLSTTIEGKVFKVWTLGSPKQILFDFTEKFIKTIKEKKEYWKYLKIIYKNIVSRDIVITSFNTEENSLLWKLWLNWNINYWKTIDFSYPVYTSIWWCKTDRYMERKYTKNVSINKDCSIDTSLKINQTHLFTQKEENNLVILLKKYNITNENIIYIQWKADNKQYLQIVLPKNAIIKKQDFFTIKENNNNKIVQFYTNARRLEAINHTIEYTIPNPTCEKYDYTFYKQPWIKNYKLELNITWNNYKFDELNKDFIFGKK